MIENEKKFVLNLRADEEKAQRIAKEVLSIEQGYLLGGKDLTVRIRKQRDRKDRVKHCLTIKQKVDGKIVEIEKKITEEDFVCLAKKADGWVTKVRYVVGPWEIDFFKNGLETYFVMAEIELPDGVQEPTRHPKYVMDNLIFSVPQNDGRFSSKKLSNVEYAKKLLGEITGS